MPLYQEIIIAHPSRLDVDMLSPPLLTQWRMIRQSDTKIR